VDYVVLDALNNTLNQVRNEGEIVQAQACQRFSLHAFRNLATTLHERLNLHKNQIMFALYLCLNGIELNCIIRTTIRWYHADVIIKCYIHANCNVNISNFPQDEDFP
jgi:hypothetical protein